jgi:hypothetical protein
MKRLLLVGALGVLLVLGVPAVASAAPTSSGYSDAPTNAGVILSANAVSHSSSHGTTTEIVSAIGGFGGGPLNNAGFEASVIVQSSRSGSFSITGTGILSGPLTGCGTLAQGFTATGYGQVEAPGSGLTGSEGVVTLTSDSKTARVTVTFEFVGIVLVTEAEPAVAALLPPGTQAIITGTDPPVTGYAVSWFCS